MNEKSLPLLFLGTAPFAVGFLRDLLDKKYNVAAVVTAPDKPQGRGRKLAPSPVKSFALENGLPVLQPEKLTDESFLEILENIKPHLGIVIAFRMLPKAVWALPTRGTINLHASLLPRWRGAAPINHALMAGDKTTGVTLFHLNEGLDEGDIIATDSLEISDNDNFGTLHDKLALLGQDLLQKHLSSVLCGQLSSQRQPLNTDEPYASKLTTENTRIDWSKSAEELHNFIRGLSPTPMAWTELSLESEAQSPLRFKIAACEVVDSSIASDLPHGAIHLPRRGEMEVVAGDGHLLRILSLQAPGKKVLSTRDYLNGAKLPENPRFI